MTIDADIRVQGVHQVKNAMAAVCVAKYLGLEKEEIEKGIKSVVALAGRGEIIAGNHYTLIDESYNANPVSMKATLDALAQTEGRRVAILGDMFELGENSDALHKEVGSYAKAIGIDLLICIGENARHIYDGAMEEKTENDTMTRYFETKEEFMKHKEELLQTGDTILIKASHGMHFETLKKELAG
jgi:UDP-N-acetylmuramoyl-tripeptide--D-alanyl-D-alanine ligase